MEIALGADHAGFELKERVKQELLALGHRVRDVGTDSAAPADYPDYAGQVARMVVAGQVERGILVCGTGMGMAMAANKVRGVRAVAPHTLEEARISREHNNANVLALGGRSLDHGFALEIVRLWLAAGFDGGRHQRRIDKVAELERMES
jgi:ribose 5-phosphate isomerase B